MIQKTQLTSEITEIQTEFKGNRFRAFVVQSPQGNVLIDTCMEDDAQDFLNLIMPMRITMIVLTHHHRDHTGALPGIVAKLPGMRIAAHVLESERMPVPVTLMLQDGDLIADVLRVIHVPGHTTGNIALYFEKEKTLFAGDAVFGAGGYKGVLSSPPKVYSDNVEQARESIHKILAFPFEKALLSHGEHLMGNAREQMRIMLEKEESEDI